MMKEVSIQWFVVPYKDGSGMPHIYFYPGSDMNGSPYMRMTFSARDIDFRYTRHSDGGTDYVITKSVSSIIDIDVYDTIKQTHTTTTLSIR